MINVLSFCSPPVPSRAPQSPYGVAISPYLVNITWLPPPAIDINGEIDFYIVEATELISGQFMTYHAVEDHIFTPARPGYAYRCRVAAFTVDQGPFTDYFIVTSQELGISVINFTKPCRKFIVWSSDLYSSFLIIMKIGSCMSNSWEMWIVIHVYVYV